MDKNLMITEIKNLILFMSSHLLASGLSYKQITVEEIPECVEPFELDDALTWLNKIKDGPYAKVVSIYSTMPEHFWENCRISNAYMLDEVKVLKQAYKGLKTAWRDDPPRILFRPKAGHARKRKVFDEKGN